MSAAGRHGLIAPLDGVAPELHASSFVAPGAVVIGRVSIGVESSIWYGAVLRGDEEEIRIGDRSNIQDGVVVHTTCGHGPAIIGSDVTIGQPRLQRHGSSSSTLSTKRLVLSLETVPVIVNIFGHPEREG